MATRKIQIGAVTILHTPPTFIEELNQVIDRSTLPDTRTASVLVMGAIGLADRWSLDQFGRLATLEEFQSVVEAVFHTIRIKTGNRAPPAGGVQA